MPEDASGFTAKCKKCKNIIVSRLPNAWNQITRSYFVQVDADAAVKHILAATGETIKPKHDALLDCVLQPLLCICGETVAFRCVAVPDAAKAHFQGRDFFKLSKIELVSQWTGEICEPSIRSQLLLSFDGSRSSSGPDIMSRPSSVIDLEAHAASNSASSKNDVLVEADREAVAGTNNGSLDWREAHENWTRLTQVDMSPAAFGNRIFALGGGKHPKPSVGPQHHPQARATQASGPVGSTLPAVAAMGSHSFSQPSETASMASTRTPVLQHNSVTPHHQPAPTGDAAAIRTNYEFQSFEPATQRSSAGPHRGRSRPSPLPSGQKSFRAELTTPGPRPVTLQTSTIPQGQVPQASETTVSPDISQALMGHRAEIDSLKSLFGGLKATVDRLNARVEKLASSQQPTTFREHNEVDQARDDAMDALADSVADVSTKIGKIDSVAIQLETLKRKVKRLEDASGNIQATPSHSQLETRSSHIAASASPAMTTTLDYPNSGFTPVNGLKRQAPADFSGSQRGSPGFGPDTNWERQQPTMAMHGAHDGSSQRKRGRPSNMDLAARDVNGTPQWEHDSWTGSQVGEDGLYRPLNANIYGAGAPGGNLIRRGIGGEMIRERRKPVRNAEGLLVRADGSIDKRSITSRDNLRKHIHAKAKEAHDRVDGVSPTNGTPASQAQVDGASDTTNAMQNGATAKVPDHDKLMKRMFPHGITAETHRLNHAEQLFSDGSPERPRMLPRDEMRREEAFTERPSQLDSAHTKPTDSSYVPNTQDFTSDSPQTPSVTSDISLDGEEPLQSFLSSKPKPTQESDASFVPSTDPLVSTNASKVNSASNGAFEVPDSYSTGNSKTLSTETGD